MAPNDTTSYAVDRAIRYFNDKGSAAAKSPYTKFIVVTRKVDPLQPLLVNSEIVERSSITVQVANRTMAAMKIAADDLLAETQALGSSVESFTTELNVPGDQAELKFAVMAIPAALNNTFANKAEIVDLLDQLDYLSAVAKLL